jgi:hypothetical protein
MRRISAVVLLCGAALSFDASPVHGQRPDDCRSVLTAHGVPGDRQGNDPCQTLAVRVATMAPSVQAAAAAILRDDAIPVGAIFSQRDFQARHPQQPSLAGTPAQGHAIPGVQPAGVAAGSIAAVGTDAGQDAIAALSLNPVILFLGEEVSRQLARYSRFADLTLFLPVSGFGDREPASSPPDGTPRYYGARLRLNVHGLAAGSTVWDSARVLVRNWITRAGRNVQRVRQVLAGAPDLAACANALLEGAGAATITANCGTPVTLEVDLQEAEQLRAELVNVRRAADSRYFGADLRLDMGDPTMGAVENASGRSLFGGLSFGRRLGGHPAGGADYGVRSRLGVRHAQLDAFDDTEFAVEGGLGFEFARQIEMQQINASAALEFRRGNAPANLTDQFQTNFLMLRGSFLLPITAASSLSINVGTPLAGEVSPIFSVNFNWGLLLPERPGR